MLYLCTMGDLQIAKISNNTIALMSIRYKPFKVLRRVDLDLDRVMEIFKRNWYKKEGWKYWRREFREILKNEGK